MSENQKPSPPRRPQNLRSEQKERTRLAILEAAREQFADQGYARVTIDEISRAVGCSRGTFYLHFANKRDLLTQISAEMMQERAASIYAKLDAALETGSKGEFIDWLRRALAWFHQYSDILPSWDEATATDPEFRSIARGSIEALTEAMPMYVSRWPEERRAEARFRVELLVTQLERYFTRSAVQGTIEFSEDDAVLVLADIWFAALQSPGRSFAVRRHSE